MRHRFRSVTKKKKKFRLLLDAAFAAPPVFLHLSKKANLAHVVHDFRLSRQASDEEIYELASREDRFVVTVNLKDFKKLVRKGKSGVIAIPPYLSNHDIDERLSDFIERKDPEELRGKAVKTSSGASQISPSP